MRLPQLRAVAPLLCVLAAAACGGGDNEPTATPEPGSSTATPRSAATPAPFALGAVGRAGDLAITVSNVRRGVALTETLSGAPKPRVPAAGLEWVLVHVRVENTAAAEQATPDVFAICAGEQMARFYYDEPGALPPGTMAARSTSEGDLLFGVPPGCRPLTIRAARIGISAAGSSPSWSAP